MSSADPLSTLKQEVRGVILSCPRGLTMNQFLKDYKDSVGKTFPFLELGYDSIYSLLRDIPDVVQLNSGYGGSPSILVPVVTDKVNHMNAMVSRQKVAPSKFASQKVPRKSIHGEFEPKGIRKPVQLPFEKKIYENAEKENIVKSKGSNNSFNAHSNYDRGRQYSEENSLRPGVHNYNYSDESDSHFQDKAQLMGNVKEFFEKLEEIRKFTDIGESTNDYTDPAEFKPENGYNSESEEDFERPPTPGVTIITEKMKNDFRELLAEFYPNGIPLSKFCKQYNIKFGVPLKYGDYGFKSFQEMVVNLPDVFYFQPPQHGIPPCLQWILFDAHQPVPKDNKVRLPHQIIEKVTKVVHHYPNGLTKDELMCIYKDQYGQELDAKKYGFKTLESLLKSCSLIETIEVNGGDCIIPKNKPNDDSGPVQYPLPSPSEMFHLLGKSFAEDECDPSMTYQPFDLSSMEKEKYVKVLVCDVLSPENVWLQLVDHQEELSKLMFSLNEYYNEFEEKHVLSNYSGPVIGLVCAIRFNVDNRWHRAQILDYYESKKEALVRYVDFGTENKVSLSSIRKLKKHFWDFPVQAVEASLYGVTPKPEDCSKAVQLSWSDQSLEFIYDLCFEKEFSVEIVVIDEKKPGLKVILWDANNLSVNDKIIAAGHAVSIVNQRDHLLEERMSETIEPASTDVNCPFTDQDFFTYGSSGDKRIQTPPGYPSRTTFSTPSHFSSTGTCERISVLMEEVVRMHTRVEELQEGIKKRLLERDVLERLVCQHPHPTPENFESIIKLYELSEQPVKEEAGVSENYDPQSTSTVNVQNTCSPAFIPEQIPMEMLHPAQHQKFDNMHNQMGNYKQEQAGSDPRYNYFRPNHHQTPQIMHHRQPMAPHHHPPTPLPTATHFNNYPLPHIPPNLIHNQMVDQKVMVQNQPFITPYPPLQQQQNVMFPPHNMNQWRGPWPLAPPPGLHNQFQPEIYPTMKSVQPTFKRPLVDSKKYTPKPSTEVLNDLPNPTSDPEHSSLVEQTLVPTAPPLHEVEAVLDENCVEDLSPPGKEVGAEEEEKEEIVEYSSPNPPSTISRCYDTSHLSEKQVRKLEKDDAIVVLPPPTNNWSDLMIIKKDSKTSSPISSATPENADYSNQTVVDILIEYEQSKEDVLETDLDQNDEDIADSINDNMEVTNPSMQICIENIWGQRSYIMLILIEESVAMLLKQLYTNFWCGEHDNKSYNDLVQKLRNDMLAYSIDYTKNKYLFDKLREKTAIEEDEMYVYFVNLSDVCCALDIICPPDKDLSRAKEIFYELSKMVSPKDEFWYGIEGTS